MCPSLPRQLRDRGDPLRPCPSDPAARHARRGASGGGEHCHGDVPSGLHSLGRCPKEVVVPRYAPPRLLPGEDEVCSRCTVPNDGRSEAFRQEVTRMGLAVGGG